MQLENELTTYRLLHSFKISLACLICIVVNNILHLDFSFFSVVSAFVILCLYPTASVAKGLERVIGPTVWVLVIMVLIHYVPYWSLYLALMIVVALVSSYLYAAEVFAYANILGGIISIVVLTLGVQSSQAAINAGTDLIKVLVLGVTTALFVQKLIFPHNSYRKFMGELAHVFDYFINKLGTSKSVSSLTFSQITMLFTLVEQCRSDISEKKQSVSKFKAVIYDLKQMYATINALDQKLKAFNNEFSKLFKQHINTALIDINDNMQALGQAIRLGRPFRSFNISPAFNRIDELLSKMRDDETTQKYDIYDIVIATDTINAVRHLSDQLYAFTKHYNAALETEKNIENIAKKKVGKIFPLKIEHIKKAVKLSLGIIILCLLYLYCDWPGGIQAVITVAVVIAQPNVGVGLEKNIQRMEGIILGAAIGIVLALVINALPYYTLYLIIIACSFFLCAYLTFDNPKRVYIGLQAGVIITLIIGFDNGPYIPLQTAFERVIGVFSGGVIAFFIIQTLWPVHPLKLLLSPFKDSLMTTRDYTHAVLENSGADYDEFNARLEKDTLAASALLANMRYDFSVKAHVSTLADCLQKVILIHVELKKLARLRKNTALQQLIIKQVGPDIKEAVEQLGLRKANAKQIIQKLDVLLKSIREQELTKSFGNQEVLNYTSMMASLYNLVYTMSVLDADLYQLSSTKQSTWVSQLKS